MTEINIDRVQLAKLGGRDEAVILAERVNHFAEVTIAIRDGETCPHCCGVYGLLGEIIAVSHPDAQLLNCTHCGERV